MDYRDRRVALPCPRDERGAALMIVLVVMMGLSVLGAAGLALTADDLRQSENAEVSAEAFWAADAGLQRYLGESNDGTSAVTYTFGKSSVTVTPTTMTTLAGGQSLFRVRAVASHTDPTGAVTTREVSALAVYKAGTGVSAKAALASGSGLLKNGGAGTISGEDKASLSDPLCPALPGPDVAGVAVPPSGYNQSGGSLVPEGSPDVDDGQSGEDMLNGTGIDWETLVDDGPDLADYVLPPDSWPDFSSLPADEWPVLYVDGNATLSPSMSGRGTVIITGNLTMNGSFEWDGLLLAGGYMTSNGYQTIEGATITGLNILLGESVPASDVGNGNKKFLYNSCYVKVASTEITDSGGMVFVSGSWEEQI